MAFARAGRLPRGSDGEVGGVIEGPVRIRLEEIGMDCVVEGKGEGGSDW